MDRDPFGSVKAILDGHAKSEQSNRERQRRGLNLLRDALEEISKLDQSNPLAGRLAVEIARNALDATVDL